MKIKCPICGGEAVVRLTHSNVLELKCNEFEHDKECDYQWKKHKEKTR